MKTHENHATIEAALALATALRNAAHEACIFGDPDLVHWCVAEERRAANLARALYRRLSDRA